MNTRRKWLGGGVLAITLMGLLWAVRSPQGPALADEPHPASGVASWFKAASGNAPPAQDVPAFNTGLEDLPPSLQGTEVDGELREDAQGRLVVTLGVRKLFDYFLSTRGEQTDVTLIARIRAYINSHLRPAAATQAQALLDSYLRYLQQLDAMGRPSGGDAVAALTQRLLALERLRAASFSPEVVLAFFGDDRAYDHYTVDKLTVMADASLTGPQKAARIQAIRQSLPAELREQLDAAEQVQTLDQLTAQWTKRGGPPAELRRIRENLVGRDAADRLEALDLEEAAWNVRVSEHMQARARILSDGTLSESTRREQLQALRAAQFNGPDRLRIEALERMVDVTTKGS
ncbi:MAG: lipase secretion chaperone [Aquabacterium sp.]|uniref:lipase secretion chaperone n=1 Tax=Aquabacterium sp. TaxID=1872578 RepID=UPI0025BE74DA|nr:lipase secretion chaperone [Aquabacterium sp.]MBI5925113.1 lipase secretion chaperone [Aquabacterium sp.]